MIVADLEVLDADIAVVSTDVFDTLLLRTNKSERTRLVEGERSFARLLAAHGWNVPADLLVDARRHAQKIAFRALKTGRGGEVRLLDVAERQLGVLGLPSWLAAERLKIELEVERSSLRANERLAAILRRHRDGGLRIIAVSDTMLPGAAVGALIEHFHGPDVVDHVYSSADHGLTKRDGGLFAFVAAAEGVAANRIVHTGDDRVADRSAAAASGLRIHYAPRPAHLGPARKVDGAMTEVIRYVARRRRFRPAVGRDIADVRTFGREVFGPIVTEFALLIWLYAAQAEATDRAVLLFCARGGVGIRAAFERVIIRLGLALRMPRRNLMISRLVAARAALLARHPAVLDELGREFRGATFADLAQAIGGRPYDLPADWQRPFAPQDLFGLMFGRSGTEVVADIVQQNALFTRHFDDMAKDADRVILCDTGLYGSTQRLLAAGCPDLAIETIQFARANYKGLGEDHFARVAGLLVERNIYSPFDVRSCVLRYWQLIESLFEPAVPSVRTFHAAGGGDVGSNCGVVAHETFDPTQGNELLSGALSYIDCLSPNGATDAWRDAATAWLRLKRAIARPAESDLRCLDVGCRSRDFGRSDVVDAVARLDGRNIVERLKNARAQLWREAAIAREFPTLKHGLLAMLNSMHALRSVTGRRGR